MGAMGLRLLVFNLVTYQWHYFIYCNNVYMDIIKVIQDVTGIEFTLCFSHLYNPSTPPPPPTKTFSAWET